MRFFDAFLDFVDDVEDIPCRRVARVDDEAGVFHRDLGIAAGKAFETSLVDEGPGKVSRRTLEGTAGAVHFQRLLAAAAVHEIVHTGLDFLGVAAAQGQFDFDDEFLGFLEAALAIGKPRFGASYVWTPPSLLTVRTRDTTWLISPS